MIFSYPKKSRLFQDKVDLIESRLSMRRSKKILKLNKMNRSRLLKKCGTLLVRLFLLLVIRICLRIYRVEILERSIKIVRILI